MSETLQMDAFRPAQGTEGAQTFARLAELVQRYLGCEAAVLSVDTGTARLAYETVSGESYASAAFRPGHQACGVDIRMLTNPLFAGERGMRFYAGLPLRDYDGHRIGMLAAMDKKERKLAPDELDTLKLLAGLASDLYEMRRLGKAN